ncbi:tat pathway signal sequence [Plectosphaerella plurivora]|uniref:Tat pathway signal sequence n=1 Tax=Plectosphaerella plurivora TaxID=936078 RepID=A0A9P9A9D6_9PEZI|nr:tat pathway signal sequence [Plectosphaerella plurivora]
MFPELSQVVPEALVPLFQHSGTDWRRIWGFEFKWTSEHLTVDDMRPMMFTYDTLAEDALNRLDEISPPPAAPPRPEADAPPPSADDEKKRPPSRDLVALIKEHAATDEVIGRLWEQANTVPDWVNWEQIERGQRVFLRYSGPAIIALTFQSLVGGMATRRVVETLGRTGGFSVRQSRRRLLETFQHILQSTESLQAIQPGGSGFNSTLRVRLLHTAVRRRIMALAENKEGYYDINEYGIPINDLDSAGTISTFSALLMFIGLPRQGIFLTTQEQDDYLMLWRYIAHVIGAPTEWFKDRKTARLTMESLLVSEVDPTNTSRTLANNVLTSLANQPPVYLSRGFLAAETYWLNGSDLSGALAIERPPLKYRLAVLGNCMFFMALCYSHKLFPFLDDMRIRKARRTLYRTTIQNTARGALGKETNFEFQYVPTLDMIATQMGTVDEADQWDHLQQSGQKYKLRTMTMLAMAATVVGAGGYVGVRGIANLMHHVFLKRG